VSVYEEGVVAMSDFEVAELNICSDYVAMVKEFGTCYFDNRRQMMCQQ